MDQDQLCIKKLIKGNHKAFEAIFKTYHKDLVRYAAQYTGSVTVAEDLVEDCFLWLWAERETIIIKKSLRAFLFSVVTNKCLNYMKRNNYHQQYEVYIKSLTIRKEINYPEANLVSQELNDIVEQAINKLPEQCRKIFLLSRHDNKKYHEIAETLEITINTVKKQMSRAIAKLKHELKEYI